MEIQSYESKLRASKIAAEKVAHKPAKTFKDMTPEEQAAMRALYERKPMPAAPTGLAPTRLMSYEDECMDPKTPTAIQPAPQTQNFLPRQDENDKLVALAKALLASRAAVNRWTDLNTQLEAATKHAKEVNETYSALLTELEKT